MSQHVQDYDETTANETEPLVSVQNLKTYYETGGMLSSDPVKAVDGVSFDIQRGETLGLVGESGCGKTTLGRTLVRLETPTDGEISFDGTDIATLSGDDLKAWRENAQIVFQDPDSSMNDRLTIGKIIREPLDVYEWKTPRERRTRVRELLDTVGLQPEHYYRYPHQFSGGQRQRIGIARALALNPDFIVLDEPTSALDVSVQAKILNLLEELQDEFGLTYLLIAHDLSVVRHACDRIAVMYLGNIMEIGDTEQLFNDPANPYTHTLLSSIPAPDPTIEQNRIPLRGSPPSPRDPPSGCPFSTRCPMKVRPDEWDDLSEELWMQLDVLQDILRERAKRAGGLSNRIQRAIGLEDPTADFDEVRRTVFDDVSVPESVAQQLDETQTQLAEEGEDAALDYLREQFGSDCDSVFPEEHVVDDTDRTSRCHRHRDANAEPAELDRIPSPE
ncbi:ATP-binding cassette domain-containing protein [Natronorubrum sp. JWXQ-INN-674]|uniref:ATP-binding cassette domain-containing protein n=1 Tax=Natronorubrum halalkaliphilum TaxID=2691917 RepID=A0A6B0VHX5_9EURY|nr:ABC transporter ATP-binding protein [Natronorubrum halalkaliphilum]MXV60556.1 ATP-binding cassette domain-containing protein [Natronorubrum halalkaliphilum]